MKPFRLRSSKDRKPLSEEQKRKRAGFVVYPLMFLLCLGSFYLIFSPSGQERERQDKGQGFNTEIPSPEDSRLEGNKKDAYEKALMEQESRKRKTFFEAAESMFAKEERKDSVRLPDNIPPERQTNTETETEKGNAGPVSSSAGAYREMTVRWEASMNRGPIRKRKGFWKGLRNWSVCSNSSRNRSHCQAWRKRWP